MQYEAREHVLKDGRRITVRGARGSDAKQMLRFMQRIYTQSDHLLRTPEEVVMTEEEETAFLERSLTQPNTLMLIALHEDAIVGCGNTGPVLDVEKTRHRATVGLSVLAEFSSAGLGRFLLSELLRVAAQAGFTQMELGVYADNQRALHLYEKCGFSPYGRLPRAFQTRDGALHDEILMVKDLSGTALPGIPSAL